MRWNKRPSRCDDYYCDAKGTCGASCAEIDIQDGSRYTFQSALHVDGDQDGVWEWYGAGPSGQQATEYGPQGRCIDTTRPFEVAASFPVDGSGSLTAMVVQLSQDGKSCPLVMHLGGGYRYQGREAMAELSKVLAMGVTPVISYGRGGRQHCKERAPTCAGSVQLSGFTLESIRQEETSTTTHAAEEVAAAHAPAMASPRLVARFVEQPDVPAATPRIGRQSSGQARAAALVRWPLTRWRGALALPALGSLVPLVLLAGWQLRRHWGTRPASSMMGARSPSLLSYAQLEGLGAAPETPETVPEAA